MEWRKENIITLNPSFRCHYIVDHIMNCIQVPCEWRVSLIFCKSFCNQRFCSYYALNKYTIYLRFISKALKVMSPLSIEVQQFKYFQSIKNKHYLHIYCPDREESTSSSISEFQSSGVCLQYISWKRRTYTRIPLKKL